MKKTKERLKELPIVDVALYVAYCCDGISSYISFAMGGLDGPQDRSTAC